MRQYIIRRLILIPVTLLFLSLIFFLMLRAIPGDTVDAIFAEDMASSLQAARAQQLREELGLTRPIHVQYLDWLGRMVRGDLGHSFRYNKPVTQVLKERWHPSFQLMIFAVIGGVSIGIPLGVFSAYRQDTRVDYTLRMIAITGITLPVFVVAALLLILLVGVFGWMPEIGYVAFTEDPVRNMKKMAWPAIVLIIAATAPYMRLVRSEMLEVIREDYIRTARAKGLRDRLVVFRHALRNALLPVVTTTGLSIGGLISGTVITESVFEVPGLGRTIREAASSRDYAMLQSMVIAIGAAVMVINLLTDIAYGWIDPRIRFT